MVQFFPFVDGSPARDAYKTGAGARLGEFARVLVFPIRVVERTRPAAHRIADEFESYLWHSSCYWSLVRSAGRSRDGIPSLRGTQRRSAL